MFAAPRDISLEHNTAKQLEERLAHTSKLSGLTAFEHILHTALL